MNEHVSRVLPAKPLQQEDAVGRHKKRQPTNHHRLPPDGPRSYYHSGRGELPGRTSSFYAGAAPLLHPDEMMIMILSSLCYSLHCEHLMWLRASITRGPTHIWRWICIMGENFYHTFSLVSNYAALSITDHASPTSRH